MSSTDSSAIRFKDSHLEDAFAGRAYLVQDGAMGTMLHKAGVADKCPVPDLLNIECPEVITDIHRQYVEAGAELVLTNTFNTNALNLKDLASVEDVVLAAAKCARDSGARYVAYDIGPLGELLEPFGDLEEEEAYELFAEQVRAAEKAGCDLIVIETMSCLNEASVALKAAKDLSNLPVIVTMTYEASGRTFMGVAPEDAAETLSGLGANAVGANCSLGPNSLVSIIKAIADNTPTPVSVRPNAGLPRVVDGESVYDMTPEEYVGQLGQLVEAGATLIGSCCGTNPNFTRAIRAMVDGLNDPTK